MFKAWEMRIAQDPYNYSPEEKELAARFNRDFTRLMKVVPKADRRVLVDMLNVTGELCRIECLNGYGAGLEYGMQRTVMAERHPLLFSIALSSDRIQ